MATVIDSLVIELGLDPKKFTAGQKQAEASFADVKKRAKDTANQVEKSGGDAAQAIKKLATEAAKFLGVLAGAHEIKKFIEDLTDSNAALDRLSKNIGQSTESISAWSGAVEQAGGKGESIQGTMQMLSQSMTEMMLTGNAAILPYMRALGVSMSTADGHARDLDAVLLDVSGALAKLDRPTANNIGKMMGIDQDTLNLLLKGRGEVELMLKRQKELGLVTSANAYESSKLKQQLVEMQQAARGFGREVVGFLTPALEWMTKGLMELAEHKAFIVGVFVALGAAALWAAAPMLAVAAEFLPIIALVTALSIAIGLLADDWYTWLKGGESALSGFWEFCKHVWQLIVALFTGSSEDIKKTWDKVADDMVNAFTKGFEKIKSGWAAVKGWFKGNAPTATAAVKTYVQERKAALTGADAKNPTQDDLLNYFKAQGWTAAQAAGIVANIKGESGFNPHVVGDNGAAYGLAQFHADRQANFKKQFGKDIRNSTWLEQAAFIQWELTHTEKGAGDALRGATSAAQAGGIISRRYERPADVEGAASVRGQMALAMMPKGGAAQPLANNSHEMHIGTINVVTQATDAQGIARDIGGAVKNHSLANQADSGVM